MSSGQWRELGLAWHETNTVHCSVCGKLIPSRAWVFTDGAHEIAACGPDCEQLYETYWRPKYGVMKTVVGADEGTAAPGERVESRRATGEED